MKLLDIVTNEQDQCIVIMYDLTYVAQRMKSTKEAPGERRYKDMKMWNFEKRDELEEKDELDKESDQESESEKL